MAARHVDIIVEHARLSRLASSMRMVTMVSSPSKTRGGAK
jgi:hypothetical protein